MSWFSIIGRDIQEKLRKNGYRAPSALAIAEVTETLYQAGRIYESQFKAIVE